MANKKINKTVKRKKSDSKRKMNFNILLIFAFCVGLLLIVTTYAWFSASLNARVEFVKLSVEWETGLYISLDGLNYSDEINISKDDILENINNVYPDHNNKWPTMGLIPVSSNGISGPNDNTFDIYTSSKLDYNEETLARRYLTTKLYNEETTGSWSNFLAVDVFLKNISNSHKSDNLYFDEGTNVYMNDGYSEEMEGLFNSIRFGFAVQGHTADEDATPDVAQNLECNNNCSSVIYEPNHLNHSMYSIGKIKDLGHTLVNGIYTPTYAVINAGENLLHDSGHNNIPLDTEHFIEQETIKDISESLFELPHGVTKTRLYIWIEGQDLDSLETISSGVKLNVTINLRKDLAGYQ